MNNQSIKFTVSGRDISPTDDIIKKLYEHFPGVTISDVFAFTTDYSRLYGGRLYKDFISYEQIDMIYKQGWTFSLPLSNMFFSDEAYKESIPILEKIYRPGNSIIVSTKKLAQRIRRDFPDFIIKASCIANIGFNEETVFDELDEAFQYYDRVTLHQVLWNNERVLSNIKDKERIVLFADTSCAPFCTNQACYWNNSLTNFFNTKSRINKPIRVCKKHYYRRIGDVKEIEKRRWRTINFQEPLHPMYDGYIYFKYGKRRNLGELAELLKKQGHPGY